MQVAYEHQLEQTRSSLSIRCMSGLQQALQTFDLPMEAVVTHLRAVTQLAAVSPAGTAWQQTLMADAKRMLGAFVGRADAYAGGDAAGGVSPRAPGLAAPEARAATAVFTVGEAAVLCGNRAPGSLVVLVQALTAPRLMPPAGAADADAAGSTPVPGPLQVPARNSL